MAGSKDLCLGFDNASELGLRGCDLT
jgi:hypothetical protein